MRWLYLILVLDVEMHDPKVTSNLPLCLVPQNMPQNLLPTRGIPPVHNFIASYCLLERIACCVLCALNIQTLVIVRFYKNIFLWLLFLFSNTSRTKYILYSFLYIIIIIIIFFFRRGIVLNVYKCMKILIDFILCACYGPSNS